jgi:outer membrane protein insertion porin family
MSPTRRSNCSRTSGATYLWVFRTGQFDDETAQRDAASIKKFYNDRGYLNAQVGYRTDVQGEGDLTVTFEIQEGEIQRIAEIKIEGNTVFDTNKINELMRLKVDAPLDNDILTDDRKKILDEYGTIGYIYAEVNSSHVFADEEGKVIPGIKIVENETVPLRRMPSAATHTQDKVIRRELLLSRILQHGRDQKAGSGSSAPIVQGATITPQGEQPGVRDTVDVAEDQTAASFSDSVSPRTAD